MRIPEPHRIGTLFLIALMVVGLSTCKKKLATPEYDSPYDETSETYIPTPDLNTTVVTDIKALTATSGGQFQNDYGKPVTAKGGCWSLAPNPTIEASCSSDGSATTNFASNLTGLRPDTVYYVRAYATNEAGTIYGGQRSFRTKDGVATFSGLAITNLTSSGAAVAVTVDQDGGDAITARGVCYSKEPDPTTAGTCIASGTGTGAVAVVITELDRATAYYVRPYATNAVMTSYGAQVSFVTLAVLPTVTTGIVSEVVATSATVAGEVTSDGGSPQTTRGICYATTQNPTTANTCVAAGTGAGAFEAALTGLNMGTIYHARAYATNPIGTTYGSQVSFTTLTGPTVTTGTVSSLSSTGATLSATVTADGGSPVRSRGICYATTPNPTLESTCVNSGTGVGSFNAALSGLQRGSTYYARAFATNGVATGYGAEVSFTTHDLPTVTSGPITNITSNSAIVAGNVTAPGGPSVTARGVVWSTGQNPSLESNNGVTNDGSGTGAFTAALTGLANATTYYVRAYATNSVGTAYGAQTSFTTASGLPTVTTGAITNIASDGALMAGQIAALGETAITARGFCYAITPNPTVSGTCTAAANDQQTFSVRVSGLFANNVYYMRAFATNSAGTAYGSQVTFRTLDTLTDIDGNVYPIVQIGTQVWMAANLRTTRYRNNSNIDNVTNATTWFGLTTGAWAHYDNNSANETVYGKLYNWHAVADSRNICPTGWHVPSDPEWTILSNFLATDVGFKLKAISGWGTGNGSNESGFNGLPGGGRNTAGTFSGVGRDGYFWSSSEVNSDAAWGRFLYRDNRGLDRDGNGKRNGFSVRCVRD